MRRPAAGLCVRAALRAARFALPRQPAPLEDLGGDAVGPLPGGGADAALGTGRGDRARARAAGSRCWWSRASSRVQGARSGGHRRLRRLLLGRPGLVRGLVGESGYGKTTIARAIAGLHPPTGGTIRWTATPLARPRSRPAARTAPPLPDRLPEPVRVAQPAAARRRSRSARRARCSAGLSGRGGRRARRSSCWSASGSRSAWRASSPASSPAVSASASRSPAPSAADPDLSSATRSPRRWTSRCRRRSIELLAELRDELGLALLFITHDLGVVASIADRVMILDAGRICEQGPRRGVRLAPTRPHP